MDSLAMLIPILGILLGVGGPMLAIIFGTYYSHKTKVAKYETLKSALEGNLSPEQVDLVVQSLGRPETAPVNPRKKSLVNGILLLSIALAVALGAMVIGHIKGFVFAALVLGFIGIANIVIALFVQKEDGGDSR